MEFLSIGFDPLTRFEDVPIMPKDRYKCAQPFLLALGKIKSRGEASLPMQNHAQLHAQGGLARHRHDVSVHHDSGLV